MQSFLPEFFSIKARHIEEWADKQIEARSLFPVLLRKLIHSTGTKITKIDFPGHDDSQRKGSDGIVISESPTPWIPKGESYWEFGTNQNPSSKANSDYQSRVESISKDTRAKSSFVFVTPRRWNGKSDWVNEKNKTGDWKKVYVFDSSDLEQWLEQSPLTQIWLAEQRGNRLEGFETLDNAWYRWSNATVPVFSDKIFSNSILTYKHIIKDWLSKRPIEPFTVVADSRDEALAFLYCLFKEPEFEDYKDLIAIFTSEHKLRELFASSAKFIPIINSEDAERELLNAHSQHHCIIIRTRSVADDKQSISLNLLSRETITEALKEMNFEKDRIERLISESGKSATVLRRRLSKNIAIKKPFWARDANLSKSLIPILLMGVWDVESENDWEIVSEVANKNPEEIETIIAELLSLEDSPVWSAGKYRGIVSNIDALFATSEMVTSHHLKVFFRVAKQVLSEEDPALELPEENRWAAAMYQKTFSYSETLRKGLCKTLVILSVYGNELFQKRTGVDVEGAIDRIIRQVLEPLTLDKLISQNNNLPHYAEASPDVFLSLLENDLEKENPVIFSLLKPTKTGILGTSPPRTGLLWSLECLAWKPQNFTRSVKILARLSQFEIDDNLENKPFNSLKAIFRSWMPQTAVTVEQRLKVLKGLGDTFSDICWKLSIVQVNQKDRIGNPSYKPRWRDDAMGAGQVNTIGEIQYFIGKVLKFLISWEEHDEETLGELVEILHLIPEDYQKEIWNLIIVWSETASDFSKSVLREKIRIFALTHSRDDNGLEASLIEIARETYLKLKPNDTVIRHKWLYINEWLQPFIDEEKELDLAESKGNIDTLRYEAMADIWNECGFAGVRKLVSYSESANIVGCYAAKYIKEFSEKTSFVLNSLSITGDLEFKFNLCVKGFLLELDSQTFARLLRKLAEELDIEKQTRLLKCASFESTTWECLCEFDKNAQIEYWKNVHVHSIKGYSQALINVSTNLLKAGRPSAALYAVQHNLKEMEGSYLEKILLSIVLQNNDTSVNLNIENYLIIKTLESLNENSGVNNENLARLEFLYTNRLSHTEYEFPAVERLNLNSPSFFMQLVTLANRRQNQGEDPKEWILENSEQQQIFGRLANNLLYNLKRTPGIDEDNVVDPKKLGEWIKEARLQSADLGREDVTDVCIGTLLSKSPGNKDGTWPQIGVCEVLEEISSQKIGNGIRLGILNSRRAVWIGPDGDQERKLATMYRSWAENFHFEFPFVGNLLEDIAKTYEKEAVHYDIYGESTKRLLE